MLNLNDVALFVQVVDRGGFSPAARATGTPKSTLAKRVAALEAHLGVRLIQRSSRRFSVTDLGQEFHRHAVAMLIEAESAENLVKGRLAEPSGMVRVTASLPTVQLALARPLVELAQKYPRLHVVVAAADRFVYIVQDGFDIAGDATRCCAPVVSGPGPWSLLDRVRNMVAVIEFAGVTVRRGTSLLLDDISWEVEEDERWVVLGPNGAGKTTLLQVAAAQLHPTSGVAGILGEVLGTTDVFELRPRIGLTSAALADRIPRSELVKDVVVSASYGVVGRWREEYADLDHDRAGELLAEVGAAHLAERTFGTLSEGERKRVQIARALMTDPELLLLDEPAAGLDLGGREDLVATLSELAMDPDSPATVLVSHHVEEIPPGFTHALMLRQGRVVDAGPVEDVVTAETLSETFGMPLLLSRADDRFAARRRPAQRILQH